MWGSCKFFHRVNISSSTGCETNTDFYVSKTYSWIISNALIQHRFLRLFVFVQVYSMNYCTSIIVCCFGLIVVAGFIFFLLNISRKVHLSCTVLVSTIFKCCLWLAAVSVFEPCHGEWEYRFLLEVSRAAKIWLASIRRRVWKNVWHCLSFPLICTHHF